jgi:thioredoxin-like negative regulator of GroEL
MIEPVFEDLAHVKTRGTGAGKVAFAKVDLAVGMSSAIARQYNVAATPTFAFFLDGKRVRWHGVFLSSWV